MGDTPPSSAARRASATSCFAWKSFFILNLEHTNKRSAGGAEATPTPRRPLLSAEAPAPPGVGGGGAAPGALSAALYFLLEFCSFLIIAARML